MAIFRLYPEKDTFISSERSGSNAGRDEIAEIGGFPVANEGKASRILTKYDLSEIQSTLNSRITQELPGKTDQQAQQTHGLFHLS